MEVVRQLTIGAGWEIQASRVKEKKVRGHSLRRDCIIASEMKETRIKRDNEVWNNNIIKIK